VEAVALGGGLPSSPALTSPKYSEEIIVRGLFQKKVFEGSAVRRRKVKPYKIQDDIATQMASLKGWLLYWFPDDPCLPR
jgi:hypothetical protein